MPAGTIIKREKITATLCGKEYELRFTMRSLAWLADRHGNMANVLDAFVALGSSNGLIGLDAKALHILADFVCAAIVSSDDKMTPDYIEDNADIGEITEALPKISAAFVNALGPAKAKKGNPPKA